MSLDSTHLVGQWGEGSANHPPTEGQAELDFVSRVSYEYESQLRYVIEPNKTGVNVSPIFADVIIILLFLLTRWYVEYPFVSRNLRIEIFYVQCMVYKNINKSVVFLGCHSSLGHT